MFDKTKERIQKFEETHENFRKVSTHLRENKKVYQVGASCFVVGIVGTKTLGQSTPDVIQTISGGDNVGTVIKSIEE